ncbi:D-alanyl-D-alanine carboxypeptidase/D-alanyl-D-alanine-endopeptidase [Shewanella seohaensis]|uniref:D-alanyl-D-alanine carboxypeptidase/D-alanyl-D-alanine endopeptidase n=1 Tax=Shewanella seohaensis TaxID=755175 RepID=UPI00200BEC8C|nr:D-alanyl-D-alanine carboxypeptidase/D-alanyl-D-alanine-endopeptidase [Shewanella seohaensis]MCL1121020.1 D-alanyl-D-alanine carboxypeptidase/D-alanyl-D-alanine-endopeptidase [Shewanella seohaensis]UXM80862.1 D-alanyl-D-alanine carboxypeptidase/D-alanyl-D-alanine-endopeptidase [Shewanella seohaensis]
MTHSINKDKLQASFTRPKLKGLLLGSMLSILLPTQAIAAIHPLDESTFAKQIADIAPRHSQVALLARDLSTNTLLYSQQADTLFIPASTQKVLTAVTAMANLGPDFRYVTELWSDAPIRQGHIAGSVYLRFSGDPTLTQDDLKALFAHLQKQGITSIEGHLYLIGDKQEQLQAPGWVWDDLGICFAAPVSSYIINQNCVYGQFAPSSAKHASEVKLRTSSFGVKVSSDAIFSPKAGHDFCQLDLVRLGQNQYHLRGCYPGSEAIPLAIAISDPEKFAMDTLTATLKGEMSLSGKVKIGNTIPSKAKLIASHSSAPLPELLKTMLLKSDNLIADSLFKRVGQNYYKAQGSFTHGAAAMRHILTELGIDLTNANIVDGSGLSRYNLLSAKQLADVLALIYQDARFHTLIDSLPEAGVSGTLQYRLGYTKPPLKHLVFAKTGSMQGVANLAGFMRLAQQRDILFVVLENGISPETQKQRKPAFSADFLTRLLSAVETKTQTSQATTTELSTVKLSD